MDDKQYLLSLIRKGIDAKKFAIRLHPVRKVEEALRALFG
jgi:hypothetical protein